MKYIILLSYILFILIVIIWSVHLNDTCKKEDFDNYTSNQEYPPIAMTGNTTNITGQKYGNGVYIASASSYYTPESMEPYKPFSKLTASYYCAWASSWAVYNNSNNYSANQFNTIVNGAPIYGEWLNLQLPNQIILNSYSIQCRNDAWYYQAPYTWIIVGSNDNGKTWNKIDTQNNIKFSQNQLIKFTINNNTTAYNEYRIITIAVNTPGWVSLTQWILYGSSSTVGAPSWTTVYSDNPRIDLGASATDALFNQSKVFRRLCKTCDAEHTEIYYKRITSIPSGWSVYSNMKTVWASANNIINQDFKLYSTYSDLINDSNPWAFCNYDDFGSLIGFPRDCGKSGGVGWQWTSTAQNSTRTNFSYDV